MTYIISEPCIDIKDRSCVDVCPVDCIHEFERMLIIDPEECIDCGACEPECPVEAIFPEDALPDKWEPFVKINYAFPQGAAVIEPARPGVRRREQRPERASGVAHVRHVGERGSCDRDSGRLQGCAPPQAGIKPQDSAPAESCLASKSQPRRGRRQDDADRRPVVGPRRLEAFR